MGSSLMLLQRYEEHGEAFLSRIFTGDETWVFHYTPESKAESITWKHPHSPVKKKFLTVQSPGKVITTIFWDVHGVLLVDFTAPGSTKNANACQETLKRLKEAIRLMKPGLLTERLGSSSFARQCSTSQFCSSRESLEILGLGNSSTSTIQS
jgi:hypothetical protein